MNGSNMSASYSEMPSPPPKPVSPCDEAYGIAASAQEELHGVICQLRSRLEVVLRSAAPVAGNAGPAAVPKCQESEMHGRLIAIRERTQGDIEAVLDMLQRLTV